MTSVHNRRQLLLYRIHLVAVGRQLEQVEHLLAEQFKAHGFPTRLAPMYSQMLVGMTALTGQWWLDVRKPRKEEVVSHVVNLAWNGLAHLEAKPPSARH